MTNTTKELKKLSNSTKACDKSRDSFPLSFLSAEITHTIMKGISRNEYA